MFNNLFKAPYLDTENDFSGGSDESLNTNVDEGQEENVDLKDGEQGTSEVDSQANEKPKKQDRDTNEQFKAARLAAEKEVQRIANEREQDARDAGFESYAEMQAYIRQQKAEAEREAYRKAGIDPDMLNQAINNHPAVKQAQEITVKSRIDTEKRELASRPFFKELEPEIDRLLSVNPNLNVSSVYNFVKGEKIDELLAKERTSTEKRTIANLHDKKSRGLSDGSDAGNDNDVELTNEGSEMAKAFGTDPKKVAKYVKNKIRR